MEFKPTFTVQQVPEPGTGINVSDLGQPNNFQKFILGIAGSEGLQVQKTQVQLIDVIGTDKFGPIIREAFPAFYIVDVSAGVDHIVHWLTNIVPKSYDKWIIGSTADAQSTQVITLDPQQDSEIIELIAALAPTQQEFDIQLVKLRKAGKKTEENIAKIAEQLGIQQILSRLESLLKAKLVPVANKLKADTAFTRELVNIIDEKYTNQSITVSELENKVAPIYFSLAFMQSVAVNVTSATDQMSVTNKARYRVKGITESSISNQYRFIQQQGRKLKEEFKVVKRLLDADKLIQGFNKDTQFVLMGSGLRKVSRDTVNQFFVKPYTAALNRAGLTVTKVDVGAISAAGHVGIQEIGINTPLTAAVEFGSAVLASKNNISGKNLLNIQGHTQYAVKFNAEFSQLGQMLIGLGVQITVNMESQFNSAVLSPQELNWARDYIRKVEGISKQDLEKQIQDTVKSQAFKSVAENLRVNPTVKNFISSLMLSALSGQQVKGIRAAGVSGGFAKAFVLKDSKKSLPNKRVSKVTAPKQKTPLQAVPQRKVLARRLPSLVNLSTLMNTINSRLTQKIKENMGKGNSKTLLNLRSGRFAESAEVVRMSESREGMITAFYRYMKNPYATFSSGGRQEIPRTRDPKLLISKSIRELATQQVANRLRAVSL